MPSHNPPALLPVSRLCSEMRTSSFADLTHIARADWSVGCLIFHSTSNLGQHPMQSCFTLSSHVCVGGFISVLHFLVHLWGTKAFHCTIAPPHSTTSHTFFVLSLQALSDLKIKGRLNGGLVQAAHTCGTPLPPGHGKRAALRAVVGLPSVKVATAGVRSCTHRQIPHSGLHVSQTIH